MNTDLILIAIIAVAAIVAFIGFKQAFGAGAVRTRPGRRPGWR